MIRKIAGVSQAMFKCLAASAFLAMTVPATAAIVVHTSDFISNDSRAGFNGFEGMSADVVRTATYTEGGIRVDHVGSPVEIWTPTDSSRRGFEGQRAWYPTQLELSQSGPPTYERLTLSSGADFDSVGFLLGTGYGGYCNPNCDEVASLLTLHYALFKDGLSVASGVLDHHPNAHYVGFSGGGFDEIRLWDHPTIAPDNRSALILDSIELARAVPEPTTAVLMLTGLGLLVRQRRNGRKQQHWR
ncbi:PEP-CTERM sorting domain-containing protein [Mitsuaria sp. CC2]|uniref:PEP-CTERM sorting domain-containing protein n=1 Tax=Mitsuaria sp. CC2 TaxID=3029186 RepID=UPI003B8B0C9E